MQMRDRMTIDPLNYALALQVESLYDPGERFCQEFYEFAYRLNSLSRHWYVTRRFIVGYLADLRAAKRKDSAAEEEMVRDEMLLSDQEHFPEFLRGAVLAHALTLLETLLSDVAREVASELGTDQELDQRPLPYVNRYIL